ncbi:MAG: YceI family protein [Gemmatimonadaceae bacterium]
MLRAFRLAVYAAAVCGVASPVLAQSKSTGGPSNSRTSADHARLHYVVAPTGNEARYRVREELVGVDLPNDAIGVTKEIAGALVFDPSGTVVRDSSHIIVTISNLKSDKDRRDMYVKRRTLETNKFPTVELVPTMLYGLTAKPGAEPTAFELRGDLTVHGVTHPTLWKGTAHTDGADIVGTAMTAFTFKDFGLDQPKVPIVLGVQDTIKLEYDFRFEPAPKS